MRALILAALTATAACLTAPALAQEPAAPAPEPLTEASLEASRGGLATPLGVDIGFGASVRTYVDGTLALETRLTWTAEGARTERTFESEAARALNPQGPGGDARRPTLVAPGASVIHDLTENRIASVVLNTGSDRVIRQETDVALHLPQLPDLQHRIAAERLAQSLQAIAPQAAGLGQ